MPPQDLPGSVPVQITPPSPPQSEGHPFLPLLVVFIVLVVGGSFFYFRFPAFLTTTQGEGTLYLGLAPQGSTDTNLYSYDLDTKQLAPIPTQLAGANTITFSPDGKLSAFVGWQEDSDSQVYVSSLETGNLYQLTRDNLFYKRLPQWSPDGEHVAFTATDNLAAGTSLEDWGAYTVDMQGYTYKIASGAYPVWLSAELGLILRTDGVYLFNLAEKNVVKIISVNGEAQFNMRLAVSPDKKTLAWSTPGGGKIHLYTIKSLTPVSIEEVATLDTHGFWIAFSPDSTKLAVQEVDWETLTTRPNPRISIFDLSVGGSKKVLDLSQYNQQYMFLSDWR